MVVFVIAAWTDSDSGIRADQGSSSPPPGDNIVGRILQGAQIHPTSDQCLVTQEVPCLVLMARQG